MLEFISSQSLVVKIALILIIYFIIVLLSKIINDDSIKIKDSKINDLLTFLRKDKEVHKYDDNVYVVGYVSEENAIKIKSNNNNLYFYLFNFPNSKGNKIVSIPIDRIIKFDRRHYKGKALVDMGIR